MTRPASDHSLAQCRRTEQSAYPQYLVEQYIDSVGYCFDYAWKLEVDTFGFPPPPSDGTEGGGPEV